MLTSHLYSGPAALDQPNFAAMQQLARNGTSSPLEFSLTAIHLTPDFHLQRGCCCGKFSIIWSVYCTCTYIFILLLSSLCLYVCYFSQSPWCGHWRGNKCHSRGTAVFGPEAESDEEAGQPTCHKNQWILT